MHDIEMKAQEAGTWRENGSAASGPDTAATDRAVLRLGAVAGIAGVLVQVAMDQLHPAQADPNDSRAAFAEYAHSRIWTEVHLGQFLGTLLLSISLLCLARALSRQRGLPGALAMVGAFTAFLLTAVFTVQMALDGIALRSAVHTWVTSTGPSRVSAFQVAEGLRGLEKGLSAMFHISNGFTLVALGLSMALGQLYARWLGWNAVVAGVAFLGGGIVTAHVGFSSMAGLFLHPALVLLGVFMIGTCISMWRRAGSTSGSGS